MALPPIVLFLEVFYINAFSFPLVLCVFSGVTEVSCRASECVI